MMTKQEILAAVREGLHTDVLTEADVRSLLTYQPPRPDALPIAAPADKPQDKPNKMSAVDVMFYIAGIVLFAAIMSVITQSWEDGNALVHILLSAGVGSGLWMVAYYLIKSPVKSDVRDGLINALLLTGSLSNIVGGYIITNEIIGGFEELNLIPGAIMLAVVGGLHIGFDRLVKRDMTLLMGIFLCVASFPALLFGFLQDADVPLDVWMAVLIISMGLLAFAARVVAKVKPDRHTIAGSFDSFAAFIALGSMYISSYTDYGLFWLCALIAGIFGIFYLSIVAQNKHLLGNASFFLVVTVITISFKYFSGYGVTTSLILATIGLLGSAAIASSINKKYFKQPASTPDRPAN